MKNAKKMKLSNLKLRGEKKIKPTQLSLKGGCGLCG